MAGPKLLALDFDGVICNTVREGLRSAWQVCREIRAANGEAPPPGAAAAFIRLRPALEVGWEFPVLLLAILEGVPEDTLLRSFQSTWRQRILERHHLTPPDLEARFDAARDRAIRGNLAAWLAEQDLYPGVADKLRTASAQGVRTFVLTTKEGRFAHTLLETHGVHLPADQVWGKEAARPKTELLRILSRENAVALADIWFVEDRLKTLQSVGREADLTEVRLFLATWGYNTSADQEEAARDRRITPLGLDRFCGDFSVWTPSEAGSAAQGAAP